MLSAKVTNFGLPIRDIAPSKTLIIPNWSASRCVDDTFKSTKDLNRDILDSLTKPENPGNCRFPLTNLQKRPMIDFVPKSNPDYELILLYL
jgi:hypothetical protein